MILDKILVLVLIMSAVSALGVDLSCPSEVEVDAEFECSVDVVDGGGVMYDLKIAIDKERNSALRIWDEQEGWKSSYFYLKGFVSDKETVKLKILEAGDYDFVVKLRDGETKIFDGGEISVGEGSVEEVEEEEVEAEEEEEVYVKEKVVLKETPIVEKKNEVIFLGGEEENKDESEDWDYVSKDGKVVDWLPYAFCLFLIVLVGILAWERF